jgi:hypothetical protein
MPEGFFFFFFPVWSEYGGSFGEKLACLKIFMSEIISSLNIYVIMHSRQFCISSLYKISPLILTIIT